MNEGYFEWLLKKAGVTDDPDSYSWLCGILHDADFYPMVEMDENRCGDGLLFRDAYISETGLAATRMDERIGGCTVLELMLSMADRLQYETMDSPWEAGTPVWFQELIANLGLDIYTNLELREHEEAYYEARDIVRRFVLRRYSRNGEGGLFPLRNPPEDQRKTELLIQMNRYLAENYDILSEGW